MGPDWGRANDPIWRKTWTDSDGAGPVARARLALIRLTITDHDRLGRLDAPTGLPTDQRIGAAYRMPPSFHWAFKPRSSPIGVLTPMWRSKDSP